MVVPSVIDSSLLLIDRACLSAWTGMERKLALTTIIATKRDENNLSCIDFYYLNK